MNVELMPDTLMVKVDESTTPEAQGRKMVFIPESYAEGKPKFATVVKVGARRFMNNEPIIGPVFEAHDRIVVEGYAGTEIGLGDQVYRIISRNEVLCKLLPGEGVLGATDRYQGSAMDLARTAPERAA